MIITTFKNHFILGLVLIIGLTTACKKKEDDPEPEKQVPAFRTNPIDYSTLTSNTSYGATFFDANGDSTVDRTEGRNRLRMFKGLFAYIGTATSTIPGTVLDSATISNLFANENTAFTGDYADLNGYSYSIKSATAASLTNKQDVLNTLEVAFGRMAYVSKFSAQTASKGTAGKAGNYLLDEKGIEWAQFIQKSLIGGYHLDYIANVLLAAGLNADNHSLVAGKNYTALEHNWDVAYGFLTNNDIYYNGATDPSTPKISSATPESYLGAYAWEYNSQGFGKLHSAFLKGRAAIHNNDMAQVKEQAKIIREVLEYCIGGAADGYMKKANTPATAESSRAHQFNEGYGFLYSTRFCKLTGCDAAYSNDLMDDLINGSVTNFYDITAAQYTGVRTKLNQKFKLY